MTNSGGANFDQLGIAVATSADGSTIVAGTPGVSSNSGAAYVFVKPGGGWVTTNTPTATLTNSGGVNYDQLGSAVAINSDRPTIVAGAPAAANSGAAYVFGVPPCTLLVQNANDSGAGSLRQAIASVCSGGTITFAPALSGATINLSSTLILSDSVTIDGSALASSVTLSGDSNNDDTGDVMVMKVNTGVTATLNALNIVKGVSSCSDLTGGIWNYGNLTVNNSTFANNDATVCVWDGGAIGSETGSGLTVLNSTFTGNKARNGSAIIVEGAAVIANSTFYSNTASGGGLGYGAVTGGGSPSLNLVNNTFSENSGSDLYDWGNASTISLTNTILANSVSGGDCLLTSSLKKNVNNLIMDGSCSPALSGDPKLGPLADNGGRTQTMALLIGSPAINAGNDAACAAAPVNGKDQRGNTRPNGAHCDIGAYEATVVFPVHEQRRQRRRFIATSHRGCVRYLRDQF